LAAVHEVKDKPEDTKATKRQREVEAQIDNNVFGFLFFFFLFSFFSVFSSTGA
jgi:hypothetical protein